MLRTLIFRVFPVLLVSLALALPASGAQKKGGVDDEACFDDLVECVVGCTWMADPEFAVCNQDCNEDYGICIRGDGAVMHEGGQSTPDHDRPDLHNAHVAQFGLIDKAEVERACTRVNGVYGRTEKSYGCINAKCDPGGMNCTFVCAGGNCLAITPDKLPAGVTLLGILQNGDNVGHDGGKGGGSLSEPGTNGGSSQPATGGDGGGGGGGGGGVIL